MILTYFSRWKYQFVSCFCLVIRVRCEERAELTSWLTLQLGLHCLPYVHPKTRNDSPLTFDRVVYDICSDNTQTYLRSWHSCCSDCYAQLKRTKTPQGWKNFPPNTLCWRAVAHRLRKTSWWSRILISFFHTKISHSQQLINQSVLLNW